MEKLLNNGFCFLKEITEDTAIYENKWSGLWVQVNTKTGNYIVMTNNLCVHCSV